MTTPAGSGVTNKGTTYANGSQITSTNLNDIVDDAVFNTNAVDDATIGLNSSTPKALFVKNAGIDTAQIKDNAVTTVKITDNNVTLAKVEQLADQKVVANFTGSTANASETGLVIGGSGSDGLLFDNDDLLDNSDTAGGSDTRGATQQSIKAYVDNEIAAKKVNCLLTNTSSSVTVSSVPFTVPFDSEISDASNLHDNSTNNSRITIGTAGVYIINSIIATLETANGDFGIAIFKNGSEIARVHGDYNAINTSTVHINICHTALLSASDYLEVKLMDISGNSTVINGTRTYFNVSLVS